MSSDACYSCGEKGHWARACPDKQQDGGNTRRNNRRGGYARGPNRRPACLVMEDGAHCALCSQFWLRRGWDLHSVCQACRTCRGHDPSEQWVSSADQWREIDYWLQACRDTCYKCNKPGHQVKDCTAEFGVCYRCNKPGHLLRDCNAPDDTRTCYKCGEEGHLARDCSNNDNGGGGRGGGSNCYTCGKQGHFARDCPQKSSSDEKDCYNCGMTGHLSYNCPDRQGGGGGGNKACYNCGETGHIARDCTSGGGSNQDIVCYRCNGTGHMARNCPNNSAEVSA